MSVRLIFGRLRTLTIIRRCRGRHDFTILRLLLNCVYGRCIVGLGYHHVCHVLHILATLSIIRRYQLAPRSLARNEGGLLMWRLLRIELCLVLGRNLVLRAVLVELLVLTSNFGRLRSLLVQGPAVLLLRRVLVGEEKPLALRMTNRIDTILLLAGAVRLLRSARTRATLIVSTCGSA